MAHGARPRPAGGCLRQRRTVFGRRPSTTDVLRRSRAPGCRRPLWPDRDLVCLQSRLVVWLSQVEGEAAGERRCAVAANLEFGLVGAARPLGTGCPVTGDL